MASGGSDGPGDLLAQPSRARLFAHLAASAAQQGPTSSRRSWGFIPAACAFISSACAPVGWSLASGCRRRSGGRGTAGRSPPTRFPPASHATPTLGSRAGWRAASRHARDGCARWSVPDGSSDASSSRPEAAARPRSRWAGRSPPWASLRSDSRHRRTSRLQARQLPLPRSGPREPARRLRAAPGADARPAGPARPGDAAGGLRSQGPGPGGMPDRGRGASSRRE